MSSATPPIPPFHGRDGNATLSSPGPAGSDGLTLSRPNALECENRDGGAQTLSHGSAIVSAVDKAIWQPGDVIDGKYEVTGVIGKGGMGIVYRVHHREWNVDMAVKTPLPKLVQDPPSRARFLREAQTWVDLGLHPNIVQCWYVRELNGMPRVFADYMTGGSLKAWMQNGRVKPGDWKSILDLALQACDGLIYGHERGVVHRDVKPANMLMSVDGRLCITDYGLVKITGLEDIQGGLSTDAPSLEGGDVAGGFPDRPSLAIPFQERDGTTDMTVLTMTGSLMGTPEYGAPEQWGSARDVDARADLYALGIILFELCCGRRPFDDGSHNEPTQVIIGRHLTSTPPDPRTFRPDIPGQLSTLILQCLVKKPDERVLSMKMLREELAQLYQLLSGEPAREIPEATKARADALNNRAVSFWDLNQSQAAFQTWEEALKLDPQHPEALYNHSLLQWRSCNITDLEAIEKIARGTGTASGAGRTQMYLDYVHQESQAAKRQCTKIIQTQVGTIKALAITPSGGHLLGVRGDYTLCLWDLPWGNFVRCYKGHSKEIEALALTPDGRYAVTGSGDTTLKLWDLNSEWPPDNFYGKGHVGAVRAVAMAQDGSFFISAGNDKSVRVWGLPRGNLLSTLWGHTDAITALVVTADGQFVLSGSDDSTIRVWELASGKCLASLEHGNQKWKALATTPDGRWVISGGTDGSLCVWDGEYLKIARIMQRHRGTVLALAATPDGRHVVSGGDDHTVRLWELSTGRCLHTFCGHAGPVQAVAVAPDGCSVFSGAWENKGQPLRRWNLAIECTAGVPPAVDIRSGPADVFTAPLVVCRVESQASSQAANKHFERLYSAARGAFESRNIHQAYFHLKEARSVPGYERDPKALAMNSAMAQVLPRITLTAGYLRRSFQTHESAVKSMAITPDGNSIISSGEADKYIGMYGLASGECIVKLEGHKRSVAALALTADGKTMISAATDDTLRLWDLSTTKKADRLQILTGHKNAVVAVALTASGRLAVSGSHDCTVGLWELSTGRRVRVFEGHREPVKVVAVTPDGRLAVSGSRDGELRIWSFTTGTCLKTLSGHVGEIGTLSITPNSSFILSGGEDKTLRLWNIETGKCDIIMKGSQGAVTAAVITRDGRFAFSGGTEGPQTPLRMWELATGRHVMSFGVHPKGIASLALSLDGCVLIAGGQNGAIYIWDLEWELDAGGDFGAGRVKNSVELERKHLDTKQSETRVKKGGRSFVFDSEAPPVPPPPKPSS